MPKIKWSSEDIQAIATQLVMLRMSKPWEPTVTLLKQAVNTLPEVKRRAVATIGPFQSVFAVAGPMWMETVAERVDPTMGVDPLVLTVEKIIYPTMEEIIRRLKVSDAFQILAAKFSATVTEKVETVAVERVPVTPMSSEVLASATTKKRRPARLFVIGPYKGQFVQLEQYVEQHNIYVELRFINKDENAIKLPTSLNGMMFMSKFISPRLERLAKKFDDTGVVIIRVAGGFNEAKQAIWDFASRFPNGVEA